MSKQTNVSSIAEGDSAISLLQPGFTCWRRAQASRVTVLIDNREYFSALRNSLEIAEQSVMLAGWQFDPRTVLEPGTSSNAGPQVGALLRQLALKHPPLDIRGKQALKYWRRSSNTARCSAQSNVSATMLGRLASDHSMWGGWARCST